MNNRLSQLQSHAQAHKLGGYGLAKTVIQSLTNVPESILNDIYVKPPIVHRKGRDWLREKGGEKTHADRILRFIKKVHGNDLSTLKLDADTLIEYYEAFHALYGTDQVSISRFYYFLTDLASGEFGILKCKECSQEYVTEDSRVKKCGVCFDLENRVKHKERIARRTAAS